MKQTIREKTFETNSSSYHTLTIQKIMDDKPRKEIEKGKDLIINNKDIEKSKIIHWSESYRSTAISTYEKAQLVLRFIGYEVEDQINELTDSALYTNTDDSYDSEKMYELEKIAFFETPLIQAFIKAIKKYIGDDYQVRIEFTRPYSPFIEGVSDEGKPTYKLFGLENKEDLKNIEKLTNRFYEIIFNPEIEMIEEYESNE